MSDIEQLENRLDGALGRIGAALDRLPDAAAPSAERDGLAAEVARLADLNAGLRGELDAARHAAEAQAQALRDEETAGQQQKARTEALHEKLDALEADLATLRGHLAERDATTAQLRRVNAQLRQNNLALREANAKGLPDAHLVNKAMLAELESIRASREAERAEIDSVMAALKPLVEEAADA